MMNTMTEKRHLLDRRSNSNSGSISSSISNNTADKSTNRTAYQSTNSTTTRSTVRSMSAMDWIAMTLLFVGGVNWGLIGLFNFNLVAFIFGEMTTISRLIYVLVGLAALYSIYTASKMGNHNNAN